ncbi:hypothetical protein [Streptomyces sp. NRRL B-1347]|uniref:hypothetical protein n=1 Tax=Streptomyces sp. NRRL B-1347 TaxID=1476877 RepID=UPI0004CA919D|nr:hypothetical protein [Streptomyces sp. NRRL B-1347]
MKLRYLAGFATTAALAGLMLGTSPASAAVVPAFGDVYKGRWHTYSWQHTAHGTVNIRKVEGPAISARMVQCNGGAQIGNIVNLPNADPTGWVSMGYVNGNFCLSVKSNGNNSSDTWDGYLDY